MDLSDDPFYGPYILIKQWRLLVASKARETTELISHLALAAHLALASHHESYQKHLMVPVVKKLYSTLTPHLECI